jgi:hypothetical protein
MAMRRGARSSAVLGTALATHRQSCQSTLDIGLEKASLAGPLESGQITRIAIRSCDVGPGRTLKAVTDRVSLFRGDEEPVLAVCMYDPFATGSGQGEPAAHPSCRKARSLPEHPQDDGT